MGFATLNIWVKDQDFPCKPDMRWVWSVDVFLCNGEPLKWCGTTYYGAHKTHHGHVEIRVPPGCYIVRARTGSKGHHNLFTHMTMVIVRCGDTACINLVPPLAWRCGVEFNMALKFQAMIGNVPRKLVNTAIEANRAVLELLPKGALFIEEPGCEDKMLEEMLKEAEAAEKEEKKEAEEV